MSDNMKSSIEHRACVCGESGHANNCYAYNVASWSVREVITNIERGPIILDRLLAVLEACEQVLKEREGLSDVLREYCGQCGVETKHVRTCPKVLEAIASKATK